MKHKMYCIFSREALKLMNGNRGKMSTQAGHAYLHSYWDSMERFPAYCEEYRQGRVYKITLAVDTTEELHDLHEKLKETMGVSLVTDAGFTVFDGPTVTCLGVGPVPEDKAVLLKNLKVLI